MKNMAIIAALVFGIVAAIVITHLPKNIAPAIAPTMVPAASPSSASSPITITPVNSGVSAAGYIVGSFVSNLNGGPRDLEFSPGGVLIASIPSSGEVVALPDKNGDGKADSVKTVLSGLNHPHGLVFFDGKLFVAEVNRVVRYNWDEKNLEATLDKVLFSLPNNNDHNNRTLTFDSSGKMYVSVGSTCNVCRENSPRSGTVIVSNANGDSPQVFADGLRNAAFIVFNPKTGELWGTEMGRDYLGDNTPPDEINIIKQGQNYGWPNCYGNKIPDTNFNPSATTTSCASTIAPVYQIQAHSAPLGLVFINSAQFPASWQGDLLVAYHGSWNRSVPTGYKVVHLKVNGSQISGEEDFISGFGDGQVGRPVDLVFDKNGYLYLSDDRSNQVYIIGKK